MLRVELSCGFTLDGYQLNVGGVQLYTRTGCKEHLAVCTDMSQVALCN